jgi:hypothetical protein
MRACGALVWQVLGARFGGDFAGLWGGSLGEQDTGGAEEQGQESRFHGLQSSGSVDLWGGAWCVALAVLFLNRGVEKPSMSYGFRVLIFQFSLVLYFSQVCLQGLSKVPGSWNSCGPVAVS